MKIIGIVTGEAGIEIEEDGIGIETEIVIVAGTGIGIGIATGVQKAKFKTNKKPRIFPRLFSFLNHFC